MVANFPGPYEVRLSYTTTISLGPLPHTQRLNLDLTADPAPGTAFNNINVKTRGGVATPDLAAAIEAWLTLIAPIFNISTVFGAVELWKYEPQSFQASFISAYSPTKVAGDAVGPTIAASQVIFTFRTIEGGIMKLSLMETIGSFDVSLNYPTGTAPVDAIFNFVISTNNWILARDTSYPFAALRYHPGHNEKTERQRYRQ